MHSHIALLYLDSDFMDLLLFFLLQSYSPQGQRELMFRSDLYSGFYGAFYSHQLIIQTCSRVPFRWQLILSIENLVAPLLLHLRKSWKVYSCRRIQNFKFFSEFHALYKIMGSIWELGTGKIWQQGLKCVCGWNTNWTGCMQLHVYGARCWTFLATCRQFYLRNILAFRWPLLSPNHCTVTVYALAFFPGQCNTV